ncbi:hypothetical protein M0813_02676 [Anaeramoeba flamelloides]|uniref:Uncharacterized protein n=1 Tax=Anaeramoeba flamelloides TaxID=1746091 RepID=A0ABQ8YE35_9EUKA|nr:hypothetical protein M0813_02676 [Anaeramoeba flamelloides]
MNDHSGYEIIEDETHLQGPIMKTFQITLTIIESDLGGIFPEKKGQINYGISMWICITKTHKNYRSIFHNGSKKGLPSPAIGIHPNQTTIHFRHESYEEVNDDINLADFPLDLNTWYHWAISVCGCKVVHYINGEYLQTGELKGEAIMPLKDCYLVDPWHGSAEGISISNFHWFPFGISDEFIRSIYQIPRSTEEEKIKKIEEQIKRIEEEEKRQKEEDEKELKKYLLKNFKENFKLSEYEIVGDITELKGPSMKKALLSPVMIESDLGGIKPKEGQVQYGISMWIKITKAHTENRSVFHNGLRKDHRTPAIRIPPNKATIEFLHHSTLEINDRPNFTEYSFDLDTWYHWAISISGKKVVLYINGESAQIGHLKGEAIMPIKDCWIVNPWLKSAEGITIHSLYWFPFGISDEFVRSLYHIPRSKESSKLEEKNTYIIHKKEEEKKRMIIQRFARKIYNLSDYEIVQKITALKGPSMKKVQISPVMIESDLGGIQPKKGQVNYGISLWIRIKKTANNYRSIFHNGLINDHRTPGIWIYPGQTQIHFRHDSTIERNDGLDLTDVTLELHTWYHWAVSVCGSEIVHFINGEFVQKGNLKGDALMPLKDCWFVDPWHGTAEGIDICSLHRFPFAISAEFVKYVKYVALNPILKEKKDKKNEIEKEEKRKFLLRIFTENVKLSNYEIIKDITELKGPSMKKVQISPVIIESDLGGIKTKEGQLHYGISMWIRITHTHNKFRSIFHNGSTNDRRTPAIWIHQNQTTIHFRHDTNLEKNDGVDLTSPNRIKCGIWYHWAVSVCGSKVIHYINGEIAQKGNLKGEPIKPLEDCWIVDPWYGPAKGVTIRNFHWFPFGISDLFVKFVYHNPISQEVQEKEKAREKFFFQNFSQSIKLSSLELIKKKTELKGPSMKQIQITKMLDPSDLGGIHPIKDRMEYALSTWIRINKTHNQYRSIFHNGQYGNMRTPAIWIRPNTTWIHFRHDTNLKSNEGVDMTEFDIKLKTWYHWTVSVCGKKVKHYINGEIVQEGEFIGDPLRPISSSWIVNPWYNSSRGIIVRNLCWIPFAVSDMFVKFLYNINK